MSQQSSTWKTIGTSQATCFLWLRAYFTISTCICQGVAT